MSRENALSDGSGRRLPNLAGHGLKGKRWSKVQRLAEELDDFWMELNTLDEDGAKGRIRHLESRHAEQRALALRGGPEPDATELAKEKAHLEAIRQRREDIRRAVGYVQHDLIAALGEVGPEGLEEIQAMAEASLREAEAAARGMAEALGQADQLAAVYQWLQSGGQNYTPPTPASVAVEGLLYERQRALGLLEVGAVR